jgi:hypothetical protein
MPYVQNSDFEILTPNGFRSFDGIQKIVRTTRRVFAAHQLLLEGSPRHRVLTTRGYVILDDLIHGDIIISETGHEHVTEITIGPEQELYDPVNVDHPDQAFYSNGLISHNCSFQGSANTLIPAYKLAQMSYKTPVEDRGPLKIYVPPIRANESEPSHVYVITVDTSQGQEQDYAVASVFDISVTPFRQVAVYRQNDITPQLLAPVLKQIGQHYCNAFILVEINDVGLTVADSLRMELEYENLIFIRSDPKKGQMLGGGFAAKARPGLRMTMASKRIGCAQLRTMVEKDQLLIFDYDTIRELTTFVAKGATYVAEEGAHDDCVMTLVLLGWLTAQHGFENYVGLSMRKILMNQAEPVTLDEPFVGFFDNTQEPLDWTWDPKAPNVVDDPDFWKM